MISGRIVLCTFLRFHWLGGHGLLPTCDLVVGSFSNKASQLFRSLRLFGPKSPTVNTQGVAAPAGDVGCVENSAAKEAPP